MIASRSTRRPAFSTSSRSSANDFGRKGTSAAVRAEQSAAGEVEGEAVEAPGPRCPFGVHRRSPPRVAVVISSIRGFNRIFRKVSPGFHAPFRRRRGDRGLMRETAMTAGNATGTPPMQTITKTLRTVAAMAGVATLAAASSWGFGVLDVRAPGPATLSSSPLNNVGSAAVAYYIDDGTGTVAYRYPASPVNCMSILRPAGGEPCSAAATGPGTTLYGSMVVTLVTGGVYKCRCIQ